MRRRSDSDAVKKATFAPYQAAWRGLFSTRVYASCSHRRNGPPSSPALTEAAVRNLRKP